MNNDPIPQHFDYPFRFSGGHAVTVDQDSDDDVRNCVVALLKTEVGTRMDLPDAGVAPQYFQEGGVSFASLNAAIHQWEPRAAVALDAGEVTDLMQNVTVSIAGEAVEGA